MLEAEGKTFGRDHVAHKCLGLYQKLGWEKVVLIGAFKLMLASGPKELDPSPVWGGENMGSSRWTRTKLAGHESRRVFGWWVSHVRSTDWAGTWALLGRGRPWEMVHRAGICGGHGEGGRDAGHLEDGVRGCHVLCVGQWRAGAGLGSFGALSPPSPLLF